MSAVKVPTVFTVIDRVSKPMQAMGRSVSGFASKAEASVARADRAFRRFTPSLNQAGKQLLSFASTAAIAAGIVGTFNFSVQSIKDYETALASAQAITGTTNEEFVAFRKQIELVAKATKKSSVDVAKGFEVIGSAQPELLKNADALGAVTRATITLSKASRDDLETSAKSLTGVMNQFSLTAGDADRTMNVLAAGAKVGAANITSVGESMKNFGSVASSANISLEESVALVEVMGKFSLFGAEAGTKLRGSILKLQQAGVGYASGQFEINDALAEARDRISRLSTAKQRDAALTKMFGAENVSTGKILLNNIDLFKEYTAGVTGTSTAVEMAETNSRTFSVAMEEMRNKWVNLLTSSEGATGALESAQKVVRYLTDNMETIVSVGSKVLIFFALWKGAILAAQAALSIYKGVLVLVNAFQLLMSISAIGALAPILLLVGAIMLVISLLMSLGRNWGRIVKAFKTDGIIGGIKAIGAAILDTVLLPLQQLLKVIGKIVPKKLGGGAIAKAAEGLENFRGRIGVTSESNQTVETVNPKVAEQDAMNSRIEEITTKNMVIDFKNVPKGVELSGDGAPSNMPFLSSNFAM